MTNMCVQKPNLFYKCGGHELGPTYAGPALWTIL